MYRYSKYLHPLVLIGDLVVVNATMLFAFLTFYDNLAYFSHLHAIILISVNAIWVGTSILLETHKIPRVSRFSRIFREILSNVLLTVLIISTLLYAMDFHLSLQLHFLVFYGIMLLGVTFWRSIYVFLIHLYRKFGFNYRNVAIVGNGKLSNDLLSFLQVHPEFGFNYIGYFDQKKTTNGFLGHIEELPHYLKENRIDELYCVMPYIHESLISKIVLLGEEHFINVKLVSDTDTFEGKALDVQRYGSLPVLDATSFPLEQRKNRFNKRLFDLVVSVVALLLAGWMFPLIALAIKLESKGPVFFIQRRTGQGNNKFWCLKFRTMYMNDNADKIQATRNDERITKVGAFLRKTSLDEFPQFFNVLIGNMSVVGPRPYMLHHTKMYSARLDKFMARHFARPGITGLAQCRGYRGEITSYLSLKNRLKLDHFYISKWSISLDFSIVLRTIFILFKGDEKAY